MSFNATSLADNTAAMVEMIAPGQKKTGGSSAFHCRAKSGFLKSRSHVSEYLGLLPRHINHMTMQNFYDMYKLWAEGAALPGTELACSRTFRSLYDQNWKCVLPMRELTQHARKPG